MKKICAIFLFIALVGISGCGDTTLNDIAETEAPQTVAPTQTSSANKTSSVDRRSTIKGSSAQNVKLGLKDNGFSTEGPKKNAIYDDENVYEGKYKDYKSGAEMVYSVSAKGVSEIVTAQFTITYNAAQKEASEQKAREFLGYCASLPYDTALPATAKSWVIDNIANADTAGKEITKTIGDANFTLYGTEYAKILTISHK